VAEQPALSLHEGPPSLPRGPHDLSEEEVVSSQRGRILQSIVETVAAKGYAATTVGDVAARARVSRNAFYALYADKEDCFLAAYARACDQLIDLVMGAASAHHHWLDRLRAGLDAYLGALTFAPSYARSFMVEVGAAGPRVRAHRRAVLRRHAALARETHDRVRAERPELPVVPDAVLLSMVGGGDTLVTDALSEGTMRDLRALLPTLLYLHLAVLVTPEFAATTSA
jgi:AcrR family transcriptional regulator